MFLHCVPKRLYQPGENELLPKWGTQFFLLTLFLLVSERTPVHWSPLKFSSHPKMCWEYLSTPPQQPSDFWPPVFFCVSQYQELVLVPGTSRWTRKWGKRWRDITQESKVTLILKSPHSISLSNSPKQKINPKKNRRTQRKILFKSNLIQTLKTPIFLSF